MNGKQKRLQRERRWETYKLMEEAARNKYKDVVPLGRTRRSELVNLCRSRGGGSEPTNWNAANELVSDGYAARHKNLPGYFIATARGYDLCKVLMRAMST